MDNDTATSSANGTDERATEYYSVRLARTGAVQEYEDPREAGAAFFRADPAERPFVAHITGETARIMARTTIAGADEAGEPRYGKSLPDSHAPDAAFCAGFKEAMEASLAERLGKAGREAEGKAIEPKLDAGTNYDLEAFAAGDAERETDRISWPSPTTLSIQHEERPEFPRPETAIYAGQEAQLIVTFGRDTPATQALADKLLADPEFRNIVGKHIPDADRTLGRGRFTDGEILQSPEALIVAEAHREGPALASFPDESPLSEALARHLTKSPIVVAYADEQRDSPSVLISRADLKNEVNGWMERVGNKMRDLSPEAQAELRPEFNDIAAKALEAIGDRRGAELASEAPKSALYRSALAAETPLLDGVPTPAAAAQAERLREGLSQEAEAAGLDGAAVAKRLETGAANALEEREWVKADIASVAASKGLDLGRAADRTAAASIVDRFYERASEMLNEVRGVRVEHAASELRTTLGAMVRMEERHGQVRFETDTDAKGLVDDMKARYGETIIEDLANGKTDALAKDFANPGERMKIAEAVTSAARDNDAFGLSPKEAEAAHDRLSAHRIEEPSKERETSRDRDRER